MCVCTLLHGQMYLQEKTPVLQFGYTLEQNSSICLIISYLWMVDLVMRLFFLWGQPLKIIHKNSAKKRSSPVDFILDTCASASSSHLFLVGEAEHMWLYPFARTNAFSPKNMCFAIWARVDTKFLNLPHHVLSMDDRPGDATFPVGPTFEDHPQVFNQKRSSPLDFIFDPCALASWSHFFGWWSWTYVVVPILQGQCIFTKKHMFCSLGARWHKILEFVPSCPIYGWLTWWCDFFLWGQPLKIIHKNSAKKRSSPVDFIFDPCALASWSHLFWLVKVNICVCTLLQNHVKNHTPSINHGTFFPGVWHLDMF